MLACPLPVVGVIRSARTDTAATPVQAALNRDERAELHVDERYVDALSGLDGFDHAWLLTWLHQPWADGPAPLRHVPFLGRALGRAVGVFATRSPRRVNPIGLSLVRLQSIEGNVVRFTGVDTIDGTPVLDVKPYVTAFDRPIGEPRCGWFDDVELPVGATPSDLS